MEKAASVKFNNEAVWSVISTWRGHEVRLKRAMEK